MVAQHGVHVHDDALRRAVQYQHGLPFGAHVCTAATGLQHGTRPVKRQAFTVDDKGVGIVGLLNFFGRNALYRLDQAGRHTKAQIARLHLHHVSHGGG